MSMVIKAPCSNCPNRAVLCHANCAKWAEYEKKRDEVYKQRLERNAQIDAATYRRKCRGSRRGRFNEMRKMEKK